MRPERQGALHVLTINTAKCDEPYPARIEAMAARIREIQPDIVACQEVFATEDGTLSTVATIGRALGYHARFLEARRKERALGGRTVSSSSGLALFSRWPFERMVKVRLPTDPRDGERVAQVAIIRIENGSRVALANLHLTHLRDAVALRSAQLELALRVLSSEAGSMPALVMGDFNAAADSPELACWRRHLGAEALMDAYIYGGGSPRASSTIHGSRRIDHVFGVRSAGVEWSFLGARVVLDEPDSSLGRTVSDHYGILVSAALRRIR